MLSRVFLATTAQPLVQVALDQLPEGTTVAVLSKDGARAVDPALATVHRTWVETRLPQVASSLPEATSWAPCSGRLRDQPLLIAAEACETLDLRGEPLPRTWAPAKRRRRTPSPSPEEIAPEPSANEESETSDDSEESDDEAAEPDAAVAMLCMSALGAAAHGPWGQLAHALAADDPPSRDRLRRLVAAALISAAP
jgi:hypothetical protein